MSSDQQQLAAKPAQENEEVLSAQVEELFGQVNDLTAKIQKLENDNGRLIEQNSRLHEQLDAYQNRQFSIDTAGPNDSEPYIDITRLSVEENIVEGYHKMEKDIVLLNKKCKKLLDLNLRLIYERRILKKKLEDYCSQDSEDGHSKVAKIQEKPKQKQPREMRGFNSPFNCDVSCVSSVVSFIFFWMGLRICNRRLILEVHCELSLIKKPGEECEAGNCSLSLENFYNVSLIEEKQVFSKKIGDGDDINCVINEVIETMAGQPHPALFVMQYKVETGVKCAGHCVAIMPGGAFIDVQKKRYWEPAKDLRIKIVNRIDVWKVDKREALGWEQKCALKNCTGEGTECIPDNGECSVEMLD